MDWYIQPNWSGIQRLNGSASLGYNASSSGLSESRTVLGSTWMRENIDYGHGALLDHYVTWGDGYSLDYEPPRFRFGDYDMANNDNWFSSSKYPRYEFVSEGDTPTYLYFLDNGLRNWEDGEVNLNWGGWSGRYNSNNGTSVLSDWVVGDRSWPADGIPESTTLSSQARWIPQLQYDFAARADWFVTSNYESANHRPNITINEGLDLTAQPGEKVYLSAETSDPDGDNVSVSWWHYVEAGTDTAGTEAAYNNRLNINDEQGSDSNNPIVAFTIPRGR